MTKTFEIEIPEGKEVAGVIELSNDCTYVHFKDKKPRRIILEEIIKDGEEAFLLYKEVAWKIVEEEENE